MCVCVILYCCLLGKTLKLVCRFQVINLAYYLIQINVFEHHLLSDSHVWVIYVSLEHKSSHK